MESCIGVVAANVAVWHVPYGLPARSCIATYSQIVVWSFLGTLFFWVTKLGQIHSDMFKLFTFTYDFLALGAG